MFYGKSQIIHVENPENYPKIEINEKNCEIMPNSLKNSCFTENLKLFMLKTLKITPKLEKMKRIVKICQIALKTLVLQKILNYLC